VSEIDTSFSLWNTIESESAFWTKGTVANVVAKTGNKFTRLYLLKFINCSLELRASEMDYVVLQFEELPEDLLEFHEAVNHMQEEEEAVIDGHHDLYEVISQALTFHQFLHLAYDKCFVGMLLSYPELALV
jgi:hypothetical protein